jgi:hypothetical protein
MPNETNQPEQPEASAPTTSTSSRPPGPIDMVLALLAVGGGVGLIIYGANLVQRGEPAGVLAAGIAATVAAVAGSAIVVAVRRLGTSSTSSTTDEKISTLVATVDKLAKSVGMVERNTGLSERALRVAHRDQDRDAVRHAIEEDLLKEDYASARRLADEFEAAFGYKQEAERFREQIRRRLEDARGREIGDATKRVDELCTDERWSDAFAESDRLAGRFGGDMRVRLLRTRVEERRQQRKVELVREFHDARDRNDPEGAAAMIRRLDPYLTPDEGRQLEEEAREVFRGQLLKLKERYSAAVHGREFEEALRLGGIIKRDFPNSQLAKEVTQHTPRLREAAGMEPEEQEVAPV